MTRRFLFLLSIVLLPSCLHGGQERAELDKKVGIAQADGISLAVDQGLAAVRSLEQGYGELWFSAPSQSISITLTPEGGTSLQLHLVNTMPQLNAECAGEAGLSCQALLVPGETPRVKELFLTFDGPGEYTLTLTPAEFDSTAPFSFILFSDIQEELSHVQDAFSLMNSVTDARFIISAGDLTDQGEEWELKWFQQEMETLNIPLFSTCGNHDTMDGYDGDWPRIFGRHSFSFTYQNTRFTLMDSASATIDPINYRLLESWLDQSADQLHIFTTHIPIIDPNGFRNGSFRSRQEAGKLLALLARGRVDLTLYGHIHTYMHFTNGGIDAIISGGGGGWPEKLDGFGRHFLVITVDPLAQSASWRMIAVD
ncbi:metallophosphoesterase [Myxococcota bacterium]|nr:metallophosphoesterase [Myxococcota bacterium]MBU1536657.1 metallophosphoesterase [Myxococcota bacterium]